jgi:hypothetical protein
MTEGGAFSLYSRMNDASVAPIASIVWRAFQRSFPL